MTPGALLSPFSISSLIDPASSYHFVTAAIREGMRAEELAKDPQPLKQEAPFLKGDSLSFPDQFNFL